MKIYTDGASSNNQDKDKREGGFAFILCDNGINEIFYQYQGGATNNQMELQAYLSALETIDQRNSRPDQIELFTDSQYLIGCFSGNKIKKNHELIYKINQTINRLKAKVIYNHVYGHSGHHFNELCDSFARRAITEKNTELKMEFLR